MEQGKLWHPANQKHLNRSSTNLIHVILSWSLSWTNFWTQSVQGFLLPIYAKYTPPCLNVYYTFLWDLPIYYHNYDDFCCCYYCYY